MTDTSRVAVVFPGQGSLRPGMADTWLAHPAAREVFTQASAHLGYDVTERWRDRAAMSDAVVAQVAVFVCGVAAHRSLAAAGIVPVVVAGHSVGEYAALEAAGAVRFEQLLGAVLRRAELMGAASGARAGGMAAIVGPDAPSLARAAVQDCAPGEVLVVANENGPAQVVVSGTERALVAAVTLVTALGGRAIRLGVTGAFHSPLMADAARDLEPALAGLDWRTPDVTVVPNADAVATRSPDQLARALSRHVLSRVHWEQTSRVIAALGVTAVLECGAVRTLGPLINQVAPQLEVRLITGPDAVDSIAAHPALAGSRA